MTNCPKCQSRELITLAGSDRVCPNCGYYESDTEAFRLYPEMFTDLGKKMLAQLRNEARDNGLTEEEAQAWIEQLPVFTKEIMSPLDARRKVTPFNNRREGNSARIWNTFKLLQFEPEDAKSPPGRLYPLSRLAAGGGLALLRSEFVVT